MDSNVLIAIIGAGSLIINTVVASVLGVVLKRTKDIRDDASATKEQIVNHHAEHPNFREENDRRHEETRKWFAALFRKINKVEHTVHSRIDNISNEVSDLLTGFIENRERIERLENKND